VVAQATAISLEKACSEFIKDAESRELQESTLRKYRQLVKQMRAFATSDGRLFVNQWGLETMRQFRQSWRDKGLTVVKKLERLRAFFRFAQESGWIDTNAATKLKNPVVKQAPTMPFTREEMIRILAACDKYTDSYGRTGQSNAKRVRALVLLLRYSGLRIGDAAACQVERLNAGKLFLYTHKTNVPVYCKLPCCVVEALESITKASERYWFWSGAGSVENNTDTWRRKLNRLFALANVKNAHPHRFRDTFAVELLLAAVPLERVSVLLGHSSIKVTEKHYSPWVGARQEQLEADLERTWARDPIILAETKGTPEVHGELGVVN
jgi:integrase